MTMANANVAGQWRVMANNGVLLTNIAVWRRNVPAIRRNQYVWYYY